MPTLASQSGLRERETFTEVISACANTLIGWRSGFKFRSDDRGNVAMIFGLSLGAICLLVGGAVDVGRWLNARDQTFVAMDSAVLAAGRALQTGAADADAIALAKKIYAENVKKRVKVWKDTVTFVVSDDRAKVTAKGVVEMRTPFLQFVRIEKLPLFTTNEAPIATTAQDRFMQFNREVALMLDVSGSMCQPCTKRDTMKQAARDLIETMMRNNATSEYKARISIIPFSGDVRPPQAWLTSIRDPADTPATRTTSTYSKKNGTQYYTYYLSRCVAERKGTEKYSKAGPGPNAYVMGAYNDSSSNNYCSTPSTSEVVPLSDDKEFLKTKVTNLGIGGGTAGHLGTAWSYYMLSPTWNSVIPVANRPQAYGTDKLRKIAILMTDGEYNYQYDSQGIATGSSGAGSSVNDGKTSAQQAVSICTNMKTDNIEVFTVGFDLGDNATAIKTLQDCATDPSHFYNAVDNAALLAAFRDISVKLTELHLER